MQSRLKNKSIRFPLIILLLCISVVPLLNLGVYIIYRGAFLAKDQIFQQETEYLDRSKMRLETCMQDVESYFSSAAAQEIIQRYYYRNLDYSEYSSLVSTQRLFRTFLEQQSLFKSVYFVNIEEGFYVGSDGAGYYDDEKTEPVFLNAMTAHNQTIFWDNIPEWDGLQRSMKNEPLEIDGLTMFIKCPMYINATRGVLLVSVDMDKLNNMLERENTNNNTVIFINDAGTMVYSSDETLVGQNMSEVDLLSRVQMDGQQGNKHISGSKGAYYVNYIRGENNWIYLTINDTGPINRELGSLIFTYLLLGGGMVAVLLTIIVLIHRWLYSSISRLAKKAGREGETGNEFDIIEEGVDSLLTQKQLVEKQMLFFKNSLKELFLIKLIRGLLQEEDISKMGERVGISEQYSSMAILVIHTFGSREQGQPELVALMEKIYTSIPMAQIIATTTLNGFQIVWLGENENSTDFLNELLSLQSTIDESLSQEILLGCSDVFSKFGEVRKAYHSAVASFAYRTDTRDDARASIPDIPFEPGYPEQLCEQLNMELQKGSLEEAQQILKRILKTIYSPARQPMIYEAYIIRLAASVLAALEELDMDKEELYEILPSQLSEKLVDVCNKSSARKLLFDEMIVPVVEKMQEKRNQNVELLGEKAIAIIRREFSLELTLESCAEQLNCHPMHLWQVFKEQNHITFSQYLEDYRFQMAQKQLANTNDSIKDIAEHLGYANPQNFIRSFKKRAGCTPGQYREEHNQL